MPPATQSEPGVKPARSVVINVLTDFFRMDASEYRAMQSPTGHKERAAQVAVLMGALFNGIQVGYVTGRLESMDRAAPANATDGGGRGKGKDPTHIQRRDRYTYRPTDHPDESWPCFQIGHEEVFDEDEKFLCAVRIWLHIYDPAFSLTQLLIAIMEFEGAVRDAMTVGVGKDVNPAMRSAAETARARISGGTAASDIHHNVEEHAAHQTQHLVNFSTWKMALEIYSGSTSNGHGCPVHPCLHQLVNCAAGRRQVTHDTEGLRGSYHPLAPEFLLNAKRPDALRAGLAHIDSGTPMAICAKQLDPANYFDPQGRFRLPDMGEKSFYWFWTGPDERSIWSLQLPRPLQGTVTPGPALCDAFLHRRYELKCEEARATGRPLPNEAEEMEHNQRTLAQFRSLALDADTITAQRRARSARRCCSTTRRCAISTGTMCSRASTTSLGWARTTTLRSGSRRRPTWSPRRTTGCTSGSRTTGTSGSRARSSWRASPRRRGRRPTRASAPRASTGSAPGTNSRRTRPNTTCACSTTRSAPSRSGRRCRTATWRCTTS